MINNQDIISIIHNSFISIEFVIALSSKKIKIREILIKIDSLS